jgi:hypothetical protein
MDTAAELLAGVRGVSYDDTVSRRSVDFSMRGRLVPVGEVTRVAAVSHGSGGSRRRGRL